MAAPLATRCPACSTVFRVVPDQLRVSGGWVRCGRCADVFDATESLVDMETGAPRRWAEENAPPARPPTGPRDDSPEAAPPLRRDPRTDSATDAAPVEPDTPDRSGIRAQPPVAAQASAPEASPMPAGPDPAPPAPVDDGPALGEPLEPLLAVPDDGPAVLPVRTEPGPLPALAAPQEWGTPDAAPTADPRADPGDMPSFVRRAERAERWRQPRMRAALAATVLLGLLGLAGQITFAYRDLAAARYPQARPALEQACALLGCRIEAARAINALAVESSGLVRVERSGIYRLSVALRNRAGIDVALPALDLTLTDTQGRLIARKVLLAPDLGAPAATLGAGRDLALQATLRAALPDTEPVAGYTIELFYP